MNFNQKCISPVVAIALLLVVSVVAVVGFNNWYQNYSSDMLTGIDEEGDSNFGGVGVETIIGDQLYLKNTNLDNLSVAEILVDGEVCYTNISLGTGISNFSLNDCLSNGVSSSTPLVVIKTDDMIIRETVYLDDASVESIINSSVVLGPPIVTDTFISLWNTSISGQTASNQIKLPLRELGTYNFVVYWGDGSNDTITSWNQGEVIHTYGVEGVKQINLTGIVEGFGFNISKDYYDNDEDDGDKLLDISQWGPLNFGNGGGYFLGCSNLHISAIDYLNLSGTTNLSKMFYYATDFTSDLSSWDVGSVTDMSWMFATMNWFDQDLSSWNVSSVINMSYMFESSSSFNQDLSSWDVSSVTDMSAMFSHTGIFNGDLSSWDTSSVTDMSLMFLHTSNFNQNLSSWDTSSVINMYGMFQIATSFNDSLTYWNTSSVINMSNMFSSTTDFNQDLSSWDVSSVIDMYQMFFNTYSFNQDLSSWDAGSVINMHGMFQFTTSFNQSLSFDTSSVADMGGMFSNAISFNKPLSLNTSSVTNMRWMFGGADYFNQSLNFDTSSVTDMDNMFDSATSFNQDLSSWDVDQVTSCSSFNNSAVSWELSNQIDFVGQGSSCTP